MKTGEASPTNSRPEECSKTGQQSPDTRGPVGRLLFGSTRNVVSYSVHLGLRTHCYWTERRWIRDRIGWWNRCLSTSKASLRRVTRGMYSVLDCRWNVPQQPMVCASTSRRSTEWHASAQLRRALISRSEMLTVSWTTTW